MYTETFSFGHYCLDSFVFPPFIFKSFYQVGTAVCHSCGCVTTDIWEMSRCWTGVGRELGVLASIHTRNMPLHSPPQIPLAPSVPISTPEPSYLTDILDLYWGYLGRILTISLPYTIYIQCGAGRGTPPSPRGGASIPEGHPLAETWSSL